MTIFERLRGGAATRSAEATRDLAAEFARALPPVAILALGGDLGAGKTTFVQGLARGLGVAGPVTSPTFSIYTLHRGDRLLVHLDAYRLDGPAQMEGLMLEEFLVPPYCLAVEWPDRVAGWLPADALRLDLGIADDRRHTIRLQ